MLTLGFTVRLRLTFYIFLRAKTYIFKESSNCIISISYIINITVNIDYELVNIVDII